MLHACFYTICLVFCYTSCQFPIFCYFCVSEKLHKKYSQNWMKQKPNVQIFTESSREPKRRRRGATGRPLHQGARHAPGPCRPVVWAPRPPSDIAPSPIKTPDRKNLNTRSLFQNTSRSAATVDPRSGGSKSSSRHPTGEGNRHQRSSSSPCLPPVR
jgi:hypothetical protein